MRSVLLCLGPFLLVAGLVAVELAYVSSPGYSANSPTLPPFFRWMLRIELLLLLGALLNVPLMHWQLLASEGYSRSRWTTKLGVCSAAILGYLVAIVAVLWFIALMHLW